MFTFASEELLGTLAAFYGFSIPEGESETSLADVVRARLPHDPALGDRIRLEDIELVVRAMHGERITRIGLDLELHGRASPA
jgi:cell volume regulation protein A